MKGYQRKKDYKDPSFEEQMRSLESAIDRSQNYVKSPVDDWLRRQKRRLQMKD